MKLEKRQPLDFSPLGQPVVEPDNDLEWPDLAPAPSEPNPSLATASNLEPALVEQASQAAPPPAPGSVRIYWIAAAASLLWLALTVAATGYQWPPGGPPVDFQPYQIAVFLVFAAAPIAFIWICAFCVRQGLRLAAEVRQTRALASDMLEPAAIAAAEAGAMVERIRREIAVVAATAAKAKADLLDVREGLVAEPSAA